MSPRRIHAAMAVLVAIASLGLAACGTEVLEQGAAEDFVKQQLETDGDVPAIDSVECPDDVEVEANATFQCTAESSDGSLSSTVTIRQLDDDGNVWIDNIEFDE